MSRLFWLGVGATVGVLVTRRVNRAAKHLTPGGVAEDVTDALHELAAAVGTFGADVRAGMAQRERELHEMVDERTGIPTGGSARASRAAD
jgi:chromosome condensin MukBEF MukE localization factor